MDPTKQPPFSSEPPSTAPPHYTSPQIWGPTPPSISEKPSHTSNNNHTYAPASTSTAYPSQSPQTPRLLHVYSTSLLSHNLTILAPDKQTTAYTIHLNSGCFLSSKPHMKVYRGDNANKDAPRIGTATFHRTTRRIDLTFHNDRPVTLSHHGIFNSKYEFPSSAIGVLRWKSAGGLLKACDLICETVEGGEFVARFEAANFALEKRGKFEIVDGGVGEEGVDEIVVSGLAVVEQMRRTQTAVAAAAAA